MIDQFHKYCWHDADIEKIEISSNQIIIMKILSKYFVIKWWD